MSQSLCSKANFRSVPKPFLDCIGSLDYDDLLALVVRIPKADTLESLFLPNS